MSNTTDFEVTENESYVLRKLHDRVNKITGGKTPTENLFRSVVSICSSWNYPVVFEKDDPEQIAEVCKSLVAKGQVKQFNDKGFPSFIPVTETRVVEYKYKNIEPEKFYNP